MPELPEIETIRRDLNNHLPGHYVTSLEVCDQRLLSPAQTQHFRKLILGQVWQSLERNGKYLIAPLANDWQLIFHLRMTGQLVLVSSHCEERHAPPLGESSDVATPRSLSGDRHPAIESVADRDDGQGKHRMLLNFNNGTQLGFYDQRRFGEVFLKGPKDAWPGKTALGPDPLTGLTRERFVDMVKEKTTRIKPLLMDQKFLAGVGNIYAQEALFKAAIRPSRPSHRISRDEAGLLFEALRETLLSAIEHRGSTSRNYRDAFGQSGSAQDLHAVYQRGGKPCLKCQSPLRESRVGGRGTVYCSRCQK